MVELLNGPPPDDPPDIPPTKDMLLLKCGMLGKAEIKMAIKMLKNGKAAGPDGIPTEVLKVGMASTVNIQHNFFEKVWDRAEVPDEWKEGLLTKLPKSGNLRECDNYRGIMHAIFNSSVESV